jgi:hypothetical protein
MWPTHKFCKVDSKYVFKMVDTTFETLKKIQNITFDAFM